MIIVSNSRVGLILINDDKKTTNPTQRNTGTTLTNPGKNPSRN